ncbi:type 2 lanthipeptide synthetase LanM [Secundilactobacillus paracollinoides]|uniref:type 2 lanthipeptide synthetase LanM n=1 Tax=Secundilactobacillus paracollinoides TaxID=240427 RepID=UPI0009F6B0C7|nr:type 2 lanthipeptide synthetase LanM [Secundilactobacillus paracollinoides]
MQNAQERIKFLHSIGKNTDTSSEQGKFILYSEVQDLLNNDIPYFYSKPKSKKLYNSMGDCINFFGDTAYSVIKKRIKNLNIEDMNFQRFIISLKISSPTPEMRVKEKRQTTLNFNKETANLVYSHDIFDTAAKKILDNLYNRAFISKKNNDVNWIQAVLSTEADNSWEISKMGMYLYDGIAGIAIFVNAFLAQNQNFLDKKYLQLKIALDNTLFKYVDQCLFDKNFFDDKSLGAFYGESSIAYTFQILFRITQNKLYFEYARKICDHLPNQVENDDICDYLLGSAGAINVFVNMFELTGNKKYLNISMSLLDHIEKSARVAFPDNSIAWKSDMASDPLAGLSHGASGFILSFSRLYKATKDKRILDLISNTLNFEDKLYDHNLHNWRDNRIIQGQRNYKNNINPVAWCHGSSGILLARLAVKRNCANVNNDLVERDIRLAIDSIKRMGNRDQNCLCHGSFGNVLCLLEAQDELTIQDQKDLEIIKLKMAKKVLEGHWSCGLPPQYENTSFMLGISGIGYALLKMNNSKLPNVLSLEI